MAQQPPLAVLMNALLGLGVLAALALAFAWLGWRILASRGLLWLLGFAAAASIGTAALKVFQYHLARRGLHVTFQPGEAPALLLSSTFLYATGYLGEALMLWRHSRNAATAPRPLRAGLVGFALGAALPLLLALLNDIRAIAG